MKLYIFILLFFSFIGVILVQNLFHELVHYGDFRDYAIDGEVCILNYDPSFDGALGYYKFYSQANNTAIIKEKETTSEIKAMFVSTLILGLYMYAAASLWLDYRYFK